MTTTKRLAKSLGTREKNVETLQSLLHAKAKSEPEYRFYSLWDKIYREDVLATAYGRSRKNGGAAGVDGETFEEIEEQGKEKWLGELQEELRQKTYKPKPLRRVWIAKANGGTRPLGIPTIRDRVVQMAASLILGAIFEADLQPSQYGFRPKLDAKMAVRRLYYHVKAYKRTEVIDADLKDYFTSVPHGALMKSLTRRISDGQMLKVIKEWLEMPVIEEKNGQRRCTTEAKDKGRGTPQGSPISPLFANVYFRRFILAWKKFGYEEKWDARIVNYADDFVICTRPSCGEQVMEKMRKLMEKLGLQVNEGKTKLAKFPKDRVDFLGYTLGQQYGCGGKSYIGTQPSKKSVKRVMQKIHEETSCRWGNTPVESRIVALNQIIRGWANYFDQGPVLDAYRKVERYTERRLQKWLVGKHKQRGLGYRQYPEKYLHKTLGLIKLPVNRTDLVKAKA